MSWESVGFGARYRTGFGRVQESVGSSRCRIPSSRSTATHRIFLPPSLQDWLPQEHLARFVVEIVDRLDLSELERAYGGRGKTPYHPAVMVALLFYGYATGGVLQP